MQDDEDLAAQADAVRDEAIELIIERSCGVIEATIQRLRSIKGRLGYQSLEPTREDRACSEGLAGMIVEAIIDAPPLTASEAVAMSGGDELIDDEHVVDQVRSGVRSQLISLANSEG